MKTTLRLLSSLTLLAFLCFAGSRTDAQEAPRAPVPPLEQPDKGDDSWEKLDTYRYEDRDEFEKVVRQIVADLDRQIAAIDPAAHATAPVGRSRAFLDLQSARRILDERMGRIDLSIPENWDLIRTEVITALTRVRTACDKAAAS